MDDPQWHFDFGCNNIGDEGAMAISRALEIHSKLAEFCLSTKKGGDEVVKAVAIAIQCNETYYLKTSLRPKSKLDP